MANATAPILRVVPLLLLCLLVPNQVWAKSKAKRSSSSSFQTHFSHNHSGDSWEFSTDSQLIKHKIDESSFLFEGNLLIKLKDDWVITGTHGGKNLLPVKDRFLTFKQKWNVKFPKIGYFGVMQDLNGAGFVALLEELGDEIPVLKPVKEGMLLSGAKKLRISFFDKGGYKSIASIFRAWQKEKGYFRKIWDKPLAQEMKGRIHIRPHQHGAISKATWEKLLPHTPKAFFIWRPTGKTPSIGLDIYTKELQEWLCQKGDFLIMPWGGQMPPLSDQGQVPSTGSTNLSYFSFSTMPKEFLKGRYVLKENGDIYIPEKKGKVFESGPLCPHFLADKMENWISKITRHPNHYKMDGVNIDTLLYYIRSDAFHGKCHHKDHPANAKDLQENMARMLKVAYDKGLMVGHEGNGYWLEKYALSAYGNPMVSVNLYTGWYLKSEGPNRPIEKVIPMVTEHLPINAMIYHDQLAMRIHDAEALNIRFANAQQNKNVRNFKLAFNALYGLTPSLHFSGNNGVDTDRLVLEDLEWIKKDLGRAQKTYETLYGLQLKDHLFLTKDRLVQKTVWEDGTEVIANFRLEPYKTLDKTIPSLDYLLRVPDGVLSNQASNLNRIVNQSGEFQIREFDRPIQ